jgi:3-phytase
MINLIFLTLLISGCAHQTPSEKNNIRMHRKTVTANLETEAVAAVPGKDAADDPAIWINVDNPANSCIIGTNKILGLAVYNLNGKQTHFYPVGRVNNVDVVYGFPLNGDTIDLAGATNRSTNSLLIMKINQTNGGLEPITSETLVSNVKEVYGFCFYKSPFNGKFYAFLNSKSGEVEQWELFANEAHVDAKIVRTFEVGNQTEGMTADLETGILYVGEENGGIWKYHAEPDSNTIRQKIAMSDTLSNSDVAYDIEGLTIYYASEGKGYLIASSQGNNSYLLFERQGTNAYIGSFSIKQGMVDGVEDTDGIDVTNVPLGQAFPTGLFVVQDGYNYEGDSLTNQNFKFVSWEKIARLTNPNLTIDKKFRLP